MFDPYQMVADNSKSTKSAAPTRTSAPARRTTQRMTEPGAAVTVERMPGTVSIANASGCGLIGQPGRISLIG